MEDCLIIGIDIAEGKDISCMSVIRKNGEEMQVINQLFNKEAEEHTNDEFFNYFGFNWVPPIEIQEEARKAISTVRKQELEELMKMPLLKKSDIEKIIKPEELLKNIEKNITTEFCVPKNYLKGATYE